jgi:hypothetical protein
MAKSVARTGLSKLAFVVLTLGTMLAVVASAERAFGQAWTVTVTLHEATSLSDDDTSGPDDIYWKATINPTIGTVPAPVCDFFDSHVDDQNHITPNWTCVSTVSGGANTTLQIILELWEHDSTSANDHFDINPSAGAKDLEIVFKPATFQMTMNVPGFETPRCAIGPIRMSGFHGDDRAEVVFTVSASSILAPSGDSDGDGLLDSWEFCGLDADGDGVVDVDLPAMGAKANRQDVFVEIDWMVNNTGVPATQHSHEPWLPALITAWNEFNAAPVTNPPLPGLPAPAPGIALHLDVGTLYANYAMDFDGDGTVDFNVGPDGNLDLNGDGIPDIGNLGVLGTGTPGGGNQLPEITALGPVPTNPYDFFNAGSGFFGIKGTNFNALRNLVFHYAVFGHQWGNPPGGSSGLAEPCAFQLPCNDFMVTLGTWPREIVDADRDGAADAVGPLLRSPSGLPVDGTVAQHAGTFLHELGHNLTLGHGGGDSTNNKPNYLSIMNYNWQITGLGFDFNGDLLADPLAVDLNGDKIVDVRRFMFSNPALNLLLEGGGGLNEPVGIGGANVLTRYWCPSPPVGRRDIRIARGTGPIDWNCNGNPTELGVIVDVNGDTSTTPLTGFNDYSQVSTSGLAFQPGAPGITLDQYRQMENATTRITSLPGREHLRRCITPKTIRFDDLGPGTKVTDQYAPLATFLLDANRTPSVVDASGRGGAPTASPDNSLTNRPTAGQVAPLVVKLSPPQRVLSVALGRTITGQMTDALSARASLQAFDTNDLNMGSVTVSLPAASSGVTTPLTAAAIFPDQLISRIEIRYETPLNTGVTTLWAPTMEPQQIDDLMLCERVDTSDITPTFPPPPKFGDIPVNLRVNAVVLVPGGPGDQEPNHTKFMETPVSGVPVTVDGASAKTDLVITRKEGHSLKVTAPVGLGPTTKFLYWRLDKTIQFGNGVQDIGFTLLRPGTLTAVFARVKGDHERPPRQPERDRPHPSIK